MARGIGGIGQTLVSLSVLAVLAGCTGGPSVEQNALPAGSGSPGTGNGGGSNTNPTNPSTGGGTTNPGATNPGTTTPPPVNEAVGDPATANANLAVLTTTRTTVHNLNSSVGGVGGWQPTALLENVSGGEAFSPKVSFDANGNGFAMFALGNHVYMMRYTGTSASWSAPVVLDNGIDPVYATRVVVDRATGNAVAAWTQGPETSASIYGAFYTASTNSWSTPQALENLSLSVDLGADALVASISGTHAAVTWRHRQDTTNDTYDLYWARFGNGSWAAAQLLENDPTTVIRPEVAIDLYGNATAVWRQDTGTDVSINSVRWNNSTQTLAAPVYLDNEGDRQPRLHFDAQGNGMLLWSGLGGVHARRFDAGTGQWGPEVDLHNTGTEFGAVRAELAADAAGNALAVWVQNDGTADSLYARRYNASTGQWDATATLLENLDTYVNSDTPPALAISGDEAVVSWIQHPETGWQGQAYAVKMSAGVWGAPRQLDLHEEDAKQLSATIDASGNAAVLFAQAESIWEARYFSPNFVVPAGGTWQSLAHTLYGVNSAAAGNALQAAMGGFALTEGMILSGFPATLSVTESITPYYTVLATDTWAHIASRVYGVTDAAAIAQLQAALGNPTLTAGARLEVPLTVPYVESANFRAPLDWSRVNTTSTTYHPLDTDLLIAPLDNYATPATLETLNVDTNSAQIAYDANGNGIAVWGQGDDLVARRYTASTNTWSAPVVLDSNPAPASQPRLAMDRTSGDAVVSWAQSDGAALSLYVSNYDSGTNTWTAAQLLETTNLTLPQLSEEWDPLFATADYSSIAMAGEHAAVVWMQDSGTFEPGSTDSRKFNVLLSRRVAGTWTAPVRIDTAAYTGMRPRLAIDSNGNTTVTWFQNDDFAGQRILTRRWNNTTLSLGAVLAINNDGDRMPTLEFDAAGNGMAMWLGGGVYARRYDVTTDTWGTQVRLDQGSETGWNNEISVDANGDALAVWVENDETTQSMYARFYDAATNTWETTVSLESMNTPVDLERAPAVALVNGSGVIAWGHLNAESQPSVYGVRYGAGDFGPATLLETREDHPHQVSVAVDQNANASVVWVQNDGSANSVYHVRSSAAPYYVVPAGATWQSLANTLYGINTAAAASALQAATGNPTLTTGLHLGSLPQTLAVSPTVPTHYVVQSGDTWQSITAALYGTTRGEAATALWDYLGRPTLTVAQQLLIPAELAYTIDE